MVVSLKTRKMFVALHTVHHCNFGSETKELVKIGLVVVFFVLFHTTKVPLTALFHLMGAFGFCDG